LKPAHILALGHAPGLEVGQVVEVESFEKLAAEGADKPFECVDRKIPEPLRVAPERGEVDLGAVRLESHGLAVGNNAMRVAIVDQCAKPAQAPAECTTGIVGDFPEQRTEPFAPVPPTGRHEMGEKGACFPGRRKRKPLAVTGNLDLAEESDP
jgi:hypothetical protein